MVSRGVCFVDAASYLGEPACLVEARLFGRGSPVWSRLACLVEARYLGEFACGACRCLFLGVGSGRKVWNFKCYEY